MFARARFAEMFDEFGVELPAMTRALLSTPAWALAVLFVGAAVVLVAKEGAIRKAPLRLALNLLAGLALLTLAALLVVALFLPLFSLIESLS
jgi:type II secretory pathway component PulF